MPFDEKRMYSYRRYQKRQRRAALRRHAETMATLTAIGILSVGYALLIHPS